LAPQPSTDNLLEQGATDLNGFQRFFPVFGRDGDDHGRLLRPHLAQPGVNVMITIFGENNDDFIEKTCYFLCNI
jgi:hypothetical protein